MKFICLAVILVVSSGIFGEANGLTETEIDEIYNHTETMNDKFSDWNSKKEQESDDKVLGSDIFGDVLEKAIKDEHSDYNKPSNDLTETEIDEIYNHTETMNYDFVERDLKEDRNTAKEDRTETDINEQNDYKGEEMIIPSHNKRGVTKTTRLWPRNTNKVLQIPYTISSIYTSSQRNAILKGINDVNEVMKGCNQDSSPVWVSKNTANTTHPNFVNIFPGSGCYSYVGMVNRKGQSLSLASGCIPAVGIIYHEMMHAMGFMHEQSRIDRDNFVTIVFGNIRTGRERNFHRRGPMVKGSSGPYDYGSVMHYGRRAFSKNGRDTIIPKQNQIIGQRKVMSPRDQEEILSVYNCLC